MYMSRDVRIRGYFEKPKGFHEQKQDWKKMLYRNCGKTRASTDNGRFQTYSAFETHQASVLRLSCVPDNVEGYKNGHKTKMVFP